MQKGIVFDNHDLHNMIKKKAADVTGESADDLKVYIASAYGDSTATVVHSDPDKHIRLVKRT